MQVIYHPDAESELIDAGRFYENRVEGLGAAFLAAVNLAVRAIEKNPRRWRIVHETVRRYLMPRFPYGIYYRIFPDHIRILAVKHHSRHPDYWRSRLAD